MNSKIITIVTHNGPYHCDDVFAVATVCLFLGEDTPVEITRTRDQNVIENGDFVLDVGGYYNEEERVFDHHQDGGGGKRKNGVPYASFGLVWKKYGAEICKDEEIAERLDRKLVQFIDAEDNGVKVSKNIFEGVNVYSVFDYFISFSPTWNEKDTDVDYVFKECVDMAVNLLKREIKIARDMKKAEVVVRDCYDKSEDKRIIVLDKYYPWKEVIVKFPEPLFIVYPSFKGDSWHAQTVPVENDIFKSRKTFPESWAGKRDAELVEISGVKDAVFCHNKFFLVVARSKEGAIILAKKALDFKN